MKLEIFPWYLYAHLDLDPWEQVLIQVLRHRRSLSLCPLCGSLYSPYYLAEQTPSVDPATGAFSRWEGPYLQKHKTPLGKPCFASNRLEIVATQIALFSPASLEVK